MVKLIPIILASLVVVATLLDSSTALPSPVALAQRTRFPWPFGGGARGGAGGGRLGGGGGTREGQQAQSCDVQKKRASHYAAALARYNTNKTNGSNSGEPHPVWPSWLNCKGSLDSF